MKIKCKYCGKEVEDTYEYCPHCGSALKVTNNNKKAPPRTIEELKAWYKAKNLPPYEVTRFFIGQDHVGPRAFGIYQEGENFIVYKNKDNGVRSIRYEGTDEAKAVNELYLKLKDEIGNQKSVNKNKKQQRMLKRFLIAFISFIGLIIAISGISSYLEHKEYNRKPHNEYYWYENTMYYCEENSTKGFDWWKYNDSKNDYYLLETTDKYNKKQPENSFPKGINNDNSSHNISLSNLYDDIYPSGKDETSFINKYDITRSINYIDAGHHYPPNENGYYVLDDDLYYYLNDNYTYYNGYSSGWYLCNNGNWIYYSNPYDYSTLGDYFWYTPYDYYVGASIYDYLNDDNNTWTVDESVSDFEQTPYYSEYEVAQEEYEKEEIARQEAEYWQDSDSNSNWDSSDSWDSSSTDWGSDW